MVALMQEDEDTVFARISLLAVYNEVILSDSIAKDMDNICPCLLLTPLEPPVHQRHHERYKEGNPKSWHVKAGQQPTSKHDHPGIDDEGEKT